MDKMPAYQIATEIRTRLAPVCERIEIAGSVRRGKEEVKDIELVCIPKKRTRPVFGQSIKFETELDALLYDLMRMHTAHPGQLHFQEVKNGPKYKQMLIVGSESIWNPNLPLDLFCVTPPAQWGVLYTLRTGPADYSKWLVTSRAQGGALPAHLTIHGGSVSDATHVYPVPEEQDFFDLLELDWVEPRDRAPLWNRIGAYS